MDDTAKRRRHRNERIAATIFVLVCAGALLAFLRWNEREAAAFRREHTYIPKPDRITPEALLLRDYVRLDTTNPPGNEIIAARWLGERLRENNIPFEIIESAPGRANLYARIKGTQRGGGLVLLNHTDVVGANPAEWKHPPFAGDVHFNMLWGRGTLDMKGIAICQLLAFIDVAKRGVPEHDVVFLAVADEERGSAYGMRWLLEHRPDVVDGIRYGLNEGGIVEVEAETVSYFGIEIGSKQFTSVRLQAKSKEALAAARIALEPYMGSRLPERILPEVRRFFRALAPTRVFVREELADIDRAAANGRFWRLPPGYRELTQNLIWVGAPQPDGDGFAMWVSLSNLPDEDESARVTWLLNEVAPFGVTADRPVVDAPVPFSSTSTPMFALIAGEAAKLYHGRVGPEILSRSTSDSRFLRTLGIDCYGLWPFPVDWFQSGGVHGRDERIRLDWFLSGLELTRRIVLGYAFPAAQ